jgi:spore germination protein GerM
VTKRIWIGLAAMLTLGLAVLFFAGPRWLTPPVESPESPVADAADARRIRARLFYVTEDGLRLTAVEREVPYGEGNLEQAKRIIEAQLTRPDETLTSAIPDGAKLKTIFMTQRGEAYLDLSRELQANHPGGTTSEILTVYALVNALTANLPAVSAVQILIDGKEIDTLAGHLDLRRPIESTGQWVLE